MNGRQRDRRYIVIFTLKKGSNVMNMTLVPEEYIYKSLSSIMKATPFIISWQKKVYFAAKNEATKDLEWDPLKGY